MGSRGTQATVWEGPAHCGEGVGRVFKNIDRGKEEPEGGRGPVTPLGRAEEKR